MSSTPSTPSSRNFEKPARESGIELLRILLMCGVVLLHYNGGNANALALVTPGSRNQALLLGGEGLFICAVNLFLLITGYFSCTSQRRSPIKIVELVLQTMLFGFATYLLTNLPQGTIRPQGIVRSLLPANYFVILYCVLYLISPYLNLLLQQLNCKQRTKLLVLSLVLFSLLPILADLVELISGLQLMGLNTVGAYGDSWGYTIVNFTLMYLIGAYIRLEDIHLKKRYCIPCIFILTAILASFGKLETNGYAWSYCNPLVIAQAVAIFLLFRHVKLQSPIINELSKGAFTCFLFHSYALRYFNVEAAVNQPIWYLLGHILFTCISIYLASWVLFRVYSFVTCPIVKLLNRLCDKLGLNKLFQSL